MYSDAPQENNNTQNYQSVSMGLHIPKSNFKTTEYHFVHLNKRKKYSGQRLYGNTCKESDLLLTLNDNEMIAIGDRLIIENIGAYSLNEVNPLILGIPNVYLKMNKQIIIGNHLFNFVCQYSDCYNKNGRNNYSAIKKISETGLYAFVHNGISAFGKGIFKSKNLSK